MKPTKKVEVIRPPKHIRQKVGASGGIELEEAIKIAEKAIEPFSTAFLERLDPDIASLRKSLAALQDRPTEATRHRAQMFNAANEIRGLSGTFGYPLATLIADAFCKFLDPRPQLYARDVPLAVLHIQAILAVFRESVKGDGGAAGAQLRELLTLLAKRLKVDDGLER